MRLLVLLVVVFFITGITWAFSEGDGEGDEEEENEAQEDSESTEGEVVRPGDIATPTPGPSEAPSKLNRAIYDKAMRTLAKAMTHAILLATPAGHYFGIATAVVTFFVDAARQEGKSFRSIIHPSYIIGNPCWSLFWNCNCRCYFLC